MPLSEHELRTLEQLEAQLSAEDPKFASTMQADPERRRRRRRALFAGAVCLAGLGLTAVGTYSSHMWLGLVGMLVIAAGALLWDLTGSRRRWPWWSITVLLVLHLARWVPALDAVHGPALVAFAVAAAVSVLSARRLDAADHGPARPAPLLEQLEEAGRAGHELEEGRVEQLHERGVMDARLYGNDPNDGVGGNGAFFLLLDEPEVYGFPPDPVVTTKDLPQMFNRATTAAAVMLLGAVAAFAGRKR